MSMSTADGKIYHQVICSCGKQNSAGICEHVQDPIYIEYMPGGQTAPSAVEPRFWRMK